MILDLLEAWGQAMEDFPIDGIDTDDAVATTVTFPPTPYPTKGTTMTTMTNTEPWWADHQNISFLLEYLHGPENQTDFMLDVDLALHVVEKPWRWTEEYEMAVAQYIVDIKDVK